MQTTLKVKSIDFFVHELIEFICVSIYFSEISDDDTSTFAFITKEIYLIDDLKIKMFIDNDFLNSKDFIVDIEKKTAVIKNCKVNITLKI